MGKHWVKALKPIARYDFAGAYKHYHPGDWFEVHNQELRELLEQGQIATSPDVLRQEYDLRKAGVLLRGGVVEIAGLAEYGIQFACSERLELRWPLTLLTGLPLRLSAYGAALGFTRIVERAEDVAWEMALPLASSTRLARDVGDAAEQAKTLATLGDLRLPLYDTGIVWVRKTPATEEVIQLWQEELDGGADELHAFLRVLYTHPVLLCTLPEDWIGQWLG